LPAAIKIVPVYKHDNTLTIAISDPLDVDTVDSLRYIADASRASVAAKTDIESSIARYYGSADDTVENMLAGNHRGRNRPWDGGRQGDGSKIEEGTETDADAPIIKLVGLVIMEAFRQPRQRYSHRAAGETAASAVSN